MDTVLFLYCLLLIASSSYLFLKLQNNSWTIENLFLILIIIFYIFMPINIIWGGGQIYDDSIHSYLAPASRFVSFSSFSITFLFILVFIIGGAVRGSSAKLVNIHTRKLSGIPLYKLVAYFFSFFSLLSLLIYTQQFGGFAAFANNMILNQVGKLDQHIVGNYAFSGRFIDLAIIPIVYFLYERRKTIVDWIIILYIPLLVVIFSNLFISLAKLKFIGLVMLFYFTGSLSHKKIYIKYVIYLISIGIIVFLSLPIFDDMFVMAREVFDKEGITAVPFRIASAIMSGSLGQGKYDSSLKSSSENFYWKSLEYFTYIQMSLQLSIDNSYPFLLFRDFWAGISDLLPSRLNIQTGLQAQQLNTSIFYNYYPQIPELTWGVPPGIIGLGMYSLSVPGVLLIAFILGYSFREIDLFFKSILEENSRFSSVYAYLVYCLGFYPINGIPRVVIYDLTNLVFVFIFFIMFKVETLKSKPTIK